MMKRTLYASLALIVGTISLEAGVWDTVKSAFFVPERKPSPTIKVLVLHDVDSATIEVNGTYNIYDPYKNAKLSAAFTKKGNVIKALPSGLKWGEEFPAVYQILIVPDHDQISTFIDGKEYKGKIYVYDIGGTISVVNEMDIEDYLALTMPLLVDRSLSDEAMAALMIAARTEAYHDATKSKNPFWHVKGDSIDFHGIRKDPHNPAVLSALESTKYMVMSQTGIYEGQVTPIQINIVKKNELGTHMDEWELLANKGLNAAKILSRSFPDATIELTYKPSVRLEREPVARRHVNYTQPYR